MNLLKKACLLLLFSPFLVFAFDETEVDSLSSSGTKRLSKKPWRTQFSLALKRNLEVWAFSPEKENALTDLSALFYELKLTLNYSLEEINPRLSQTELFLTGSFLSNFDGGHCDRWLDDQEPAYIWCNVGNVVGGFQTPFYNKGSFFSDFTFSFIPYPLSFFSREEGLVNSFSGAFSTLYFFKKEKQWNAALSTSHNFTYRKFTKTLTGPIIEEKGIKKIKGDRYNIPLETEHITQLILRQNFNKYLPSNAQLFSSYFIGINLHRPHSVEPNCSPWACGDREHYLSLGASSSWKLKDRTYLTGSLFWRDKLIVYNPKDENVKKGKSEIDFKLDRWFFKLTFSYSF